MSPPRDSDVPPPVSPSPAKPGSPDWFRLDSGTEPSFRAKRTPPQSVPDLNWPQPPDLELPEPFPLPAGPAKRPRRKLLPALQTGLILLLGALAIAATIAGWWFSTEARRAKQDRDHANLDRDAAQQELRQARLDDADAYASTAQLGAAEGDPGRALLLLANAVRLAHAEDDPDREHANRIRFHSVERQMPITVHAVAGLPAGSRVTGWAIDRTGHWALLQALGHLHLWDLQEEVERPLPAEVDPASVLATAWSPNGSWLALGTQANVVFLCPFPAGEPPVRIDFAGRVRAVQFSSDGNVLAIGGDTLRLWNCPEKRFLDSEFRFPQPALALRFSPKGDRLVAGCQDGKAYVFALNPSETEPLLQAPWSARFGCPAPCFADDGRTLICLHRDRRRIVVWDIDKKQARYEFPKTGAERTLNCLAISPNGQSLAVAGADGLAIINAQTGERNHTPQWLPHAGIQALAFSPDSERLLSAGRDSTIRLWKANGQAVVPAAIHSGSVADVTFLETGKQFAVVQNDGMVCTWRLPQSAAFHQDVPPGARCQVIAHPDDRHFLISGTPILAAPVTATRVLDAETSQSAGPLLQAKGHILHAALCATQPWAALAATTAKDTDEREKIMFAAPERTQLLEVWNWQTGQRLYEPIALPSEPRAVAFHPDGRSLAVLTAAGHVQMFDPKTGKRLHAWLNPQPVAAQPDGIRDGGSVCFSPDGQNLLTWGIDDSLRVFDAHTVQPRLTLRQGDGHFLNVAFTPNLRRLATCHERQTVAIWNFATGQLDADAKILTQSEHASSVQFSSDDRLLLVAGQSGQARLWDWRSGQLACPPMAHPSAVCDAWFLPDSPWLVTVATDGLPRLWDSRSGLPLTFSVNTSNSKCQSSILLRHGRTVVTACAGGGVYGYDLEGMLRPNSIPTASDSQNDQLARLAQVISGSELVNPGNVQPLPPERWLRLFREVRPERMMGEK
ncbi:MAG TPA: WD40 repeat domain-containing protein [Gemmataceae bacterium]|nr:WD40 repeat domain-containing protein [Gemmataceae bacterium]